MRDVLRIALPLSVWITSFSAVYALHGVICGGAWPWLADPERARIALVSSWALAVALQTAVLGLLISPRLGISPGHLRWISIALGLAAVVATLWTLFPVAVLAMCPQA